MLSIRQGFKTQFDRHGMLLRQQLEMIISNGTESLLLM